MTKAYEQLMAIAFYVGGASECVCEHNESLLAELQRDEALGDDLLKRAKELCELLQECSGGGLHR